jgi:uncharacterized membrane-anchored protein YhcB (DUF1043 family)
MEYILLIIADIALGGIAWRLGKRNEKSNQNMEAAIKEMNSAVVEMRRMNENVVVRVSSLETRVSSLEAA